jgi:hypothetical protein
MPYYKKVNGWIHKNTGWKTFKHCCGAMEGFMDAFIESGFDFGQIERCAIQAGFPKKLAKICGFQAIRAIGDNPLMQIALLKRGVTIDRIAKKINQLLEAKGPKGKPDNLAQARVLETSIKLLNVAPPTRISIDKTEKRELTLSEEDRKKIEQIKGIKFIDVEPEPDGISMPEPEPNAGDPDNHPGEGPEGPVLAEEGSERPVLF